MVKAVLTTNDGGIIQRTFQSMDELTDHVKKNHGLYEAIVAKVIHNAKDLRQGRDDRTVARA